MNPLRSALSVDDWVRLNTLLEEALALDEEERSSWLERVVPETPHLRNALRELLGRSFSGEYDDHRVPLAIARVASDALGALHLDQPGHQIGPWRLERLLAEGGMGAVWLAERADGVMKRTAALKLPRSEWIDRGMTERIARERAILARLQHPNIAVLYDAGVTEESRPYLALEYVEGQPIDAYCRERPLGLRPILQLFLPVVRAVAYAHSRLIIHRDIKPSNILVTADGLPKLLDFGVSKLIAGDKTPTEATALTQVAGRPLTLAYAAPEQLREAPLTVALDVYALGAVLFELVTGARLYLSATPYALEQEILAGDVRRPSAAASTRGRARELRGDLDAIILNALKRSPEERYASAAAFADDIERYLAGQPVHARPDRRFYRLRKFVARNRLPVAAGAAIAFAVAVGAGVSLWQAQIARKQAAEATALNTFILSLIKQADPSASQQTARADLVTLAAIEERIERAFLRSPVQALHLRTTVATAYYNRSEMGAARRAFERAAHDAVGVVAQDDLALLSAHVYLADPRLIDSAESAQRLLRAIDVLRTKGAAGAELLVDALLIRHELSDKYGIPQFTSPVHRFDALAEALEVAALHFGEGSNQHLKVLRPYASLVVRSGDRALAVQLMEGALAKARQRIDNPGATAEFIGLEAMLHAQLCGTPRAMEGLGGLWHTLEAVRAKHDETSVLLEELYGGLGLCYDRQGDSSMAWFYRAAFDVAAAREQVPSLRLMNRALQGMASALWVKDATAAQDYYRLAMANVPAVADPALQARFGRRAKLAEVCLLYIQGEAGEADRAASALIEAWRGEPNLPLTYDEVMMRRCQSYAQRDAGRTEDAARSAQDLLALCADNADFFVRCRNRGLLALAFARIDQGRADEALALLAERSGLPLRSDPNPEALLAKGRAFLALGRLPEALAALEAAQDFWSKSSNPQGPFAAENAYWLGHAYVAASDKRGRAMVGEARRALAASPLKSHRELAARS